MARVVEPVLALGSHLPGTGWLHERRAFLSGILLLLPAFVTSLLLSVIPLIYLVRLSLTREATFFFSPEYTLENYRIIVTRYMPNLWETIYLAGISSILDLVVGYPFAYILVRRVRYRDLVRATMMFPLFGPLYLSLGMHYLFLPNGPLAPFLRAIGVEGTQLLYSQASVVFAMAIFTLPFMVMNIGAALSNVDVTLEEAATCLGAQPWQTFVHILLPLSRSGILAGVLMCFGWNLGVYVQPLVLGTLREQRVLAIALYQKGMIQFDYGLAAAMGVVLMALAFSVTWLSLRLSRGALGA
ncbi:ABC transporter permease subunit [Thermomicrobium sp. 4228-Ro]|uniref:ABC transporter permease n=1 Tax=Thermomicrobium sp. 4228-Ro TaxID=2993937 RepID=UPI002248B4B1|nr:ABC transporter permease subunit [Thermomicrobium sp. 4228-Ro]MCX2728069.1 ABC transporter permease subunit [Thermomicrobium sp. 4228-Ro]